MFEVIDDFVNQSDVETIYDAFTDSDVTASCERS